MLRGSGPRSTRRRVAWSSRRRKRTLALALVGQANEQALTGENRILETQPADLPKPEAGFLGNCCGQAQAGVTALVQKIPHERELVALKRPRHAHCLRERWISGTTGLPYW